MGCRQGEKERGNRACAGLVREGEKGKAGWAVAGFLGRVSVGFGLGSFPFAPFLIPKTTLLKLKLVEFKLKFEFNPSTQTNKRDAPA